MSLLISRTHIPMYLKKKIHISLKIELLVVPGFIKLHNSFLELYSSKRFVVYNVLKILRFCNQFFGLFLSPNKTYISVFANILTRFPYKCMNNIDQMYDFVLQLTKKGIVHKLCKFLFKFVVCFTSQLSVKFYIGFQPARLIKLKNSMYFLQFQAMIQVEF